MGRPTEGWKLRQRGGSWTVRFTVQGRTVERSTGIRTDEPRSRAASEAARIYADELRAPRAREGRLAPRTGGICEEGRKWLTAEEPLRDELTNLTYARYVRTHWEPWFKRVDQITARSVEEYRTERLKRVAASTVSKELTALRAFVRWLELDVKVPGVPKRAVGNRWPSQWRGSQPISIPEAEAVIAQLQGLAQTRYRFVLETSLRPETVDSLELGQHWQTGATELVLADEDDKNRYARTLPLTPAACEALAEAAAQAEAAGRTQLFPSRHRKALKAAAAKVLPPDKARRFTPTDLRAARITAWLEQSANLPGVQFLAGHRRATTTSRYAKPTLRAAYDVLRGRPSGE
jgi:site-specific recombinase XerC